MKTTFVERWAIISLMLFMLLAPGLAPAQPDFGRIVAFGTSLSDPGNAFALRGLADTPPYDAMDFLLIPDRPYAKGGHHYSNGPTWIEQFGRNLGLGGSVRPAFQGSSAGASNYAVGSARAYDDGVNVNLSDQVNAFLDNFGGAAPSDALYAVEIGANDVRDAMAAFAAGADGSAILHNALAAIGKNIGVLYASGARTFIVWNVPNIRLTPAIRMVDSMNPGAGQLAEIITQSFNSGLDAVLTSLSGLPGIEIVKFDAYRKLDEIVTDPAAYGLVQVETACVTPNVSPFDCQTPDEFLFWDGIHPTRTVHSILAQEAALLLAQSKGIQ